MTETQTAPNIFPSSFLTGTPSAPTYKPIINHATTSPQQCTKQDFDASKHLDFTPPESVVLMKDIGLEDVGVSPVAVSQPFHLFSEEAVQQMRSEILDPKVMEECGVHSNIAASQVRGYAQKHGPFTHASWTHPKTLAIISEIAGIDLVTEMDFEIGHINISIKSEQERNREMAEFAERQQFEADEGIAGCPWEDERPIVDWHTDSYPFVCVTMLSDCTNMVGGETALRTGTGEIMKVRGPQMGCAVVLQGRYIEHQALRALGATERITMVTSFRPRRPDLPDDTVLATVRPISDLSELYYQFSEYRLEILEDRIRTQLRELRVARDGGKKLAIGQLKAFLKEQEAFLAHMNKEIIENETVTRAFYDDRDVILPSEDRLA